MITTTSSGLNGGSPQGPLHAADVQLTETLDDLDVAAPRYADWVVSLLEPHLGSDVLEVGAGHGTIAERMARTGLETPPGISRRASSNSRAEAVSATRATRRPRPRSS